MNAADYVLAFGAVFFGVLIPVIIIRAHRLKETIVYAGALISGLMSLACIAVFFQQFALLAVFFILAIIIGIVAYPELREVNLREADRQLRETNVTEPVKARDLLNMKAWYKLAFRWGIRKTLSLYSAVCYSIAAVVFFPLYVMGVTSLPYYIAPSIVMGIYIVQFYQQLKKNQLTPQGSTKQALLPESSA